MHGLRQQLVGVGEQVGVGPQLVHGEGLVTKVVLVTKASVEMRIKSGCSTSHNLWC